VKVGTLAAAQLLKVLPRARISRAIGQLSDRPLSPAVSKAVVRLYSKAWGVDLSEAERPNHSGAFESFDQFFTRRLRPGAREIPADGDVVLCPSDGRLQSCGPIDEDGRLQVKGQPYRVADLIDDEGAQPFRGGQFAVIYLSPRDYHRVHSPAAGEVIEVRSAPGDLFPVNSLGERIPGLLARNRRVAITIDAGRFGRIAVVMVAAMVVGRITVTGWDAADVPLGRLTPAEPLMLAAGDELGVFHLGSTVVLLLEGDAIEPIRRATGPIRLGDVLAAGRASAGADGTSQENSRGRA
jgi:phosphatidylserine decarboxylase